MSLVVAPPKIHRLTQKDWSLIYPFIKTNTQDLPEGFFSSYPTPESIDANNVFGIFDVYGDLASIAQAKFGENMTSTEEMLAPVLPEGIKKSQIVELSGGLTAYKHRRAGHLKSLIARCKDSVRDTRDCALTFCHVDNDRANNFAIANCGSLVAGNYDFFGELLNVYREDFNRESETSSSILL